LKTFLICARGGSKGIKEKNLKIFFGKTLVEHSILFAKKYINSEIYLSSENKRILSIGKKNKIKIIERPSYLAKDKTNEIEVWKHFLNQKKKEKKMPKYFINLPPTAPLRTLSSVDKAISKFKKNNYDLVVIVIKSSKSPYFNIVEERKSLIKPSFYKKNIYRRQSTPTTYDLTTITYIVKSKFILQNNIKNIFQGRVGFVETTNFAETIDIDEPKDLKIAKLFYNKII
jgi:CMP-N,N'-diacetyllegionaminic acid synthase